MREAVGTWLRDVPIRVACDVRNPLLGERGAARVFGPQKGADPGMVDELEARLAALDELAPYRDLPGAGAGGGLGAAFAALGGELCEGAELVLDTIGFDELAQHADLVVTGEGTVDATTLEGRRRERCAAAANGSVCAASSSAGSCATGSRRTPSRATRAAGEDLAQLGEELALSSSILP